jgi:NitT/TauT family transport system substrate-binding protein
MKKGMSLLSWAIALLGFHCFVLGQPTLAQDKIVIGYQPYDTISYQVSVNQELGLWKKYFPKNVEVEFQPALQGSIIVNNMLAGKQQIGYMSIMPATMAATKPEQAQIRIVGSSGMSDGMRCSLLLVRKDAPQFKSQEEAIKWIDGKVVASPKGSAADQYLRMIFEKYKVKPSEYLNQSIEVIATNFRIGKLDAAAMWEPTISRICDLVGEGIARIVATGTCVSNPDLGTIVMRGDLVEKSPQLAEAWLKSELEAQLFLLDPNNWAKATDMFAKYATGMPKRALWYSIYGQIPSEVGGTKEREWKPFILDEKVQKNIVDVFAFLHKEKVIKYDKPLPNTIDDSITRKVLQEKGLKSPIGYIYGQPPEKDPFK